VGYNIVLELSPEQKERLKMTALQVHQTVRGFVTTLVVTAIDMYETQSKQSTKKQNKNNKEGN
jgi:hypothetical protein